MSSTLWRTVKKIPIQHPFAFGVIISTIKTSGSDLLVQKAVEQRTEIDWKRNAAFATFGLVYLGGFQYFLYVPVFSRLFPGAGAFAAKPLSAKLKDTAGLANVAKQTFIDQFIHHPFLYFPAFYLVKDFVVNEGKQLPNVGKVLSEYRETVKDDLLALWKIWLPSTFLNFAFMPMWARIPWVAGTSALWTCILSAMRGGSKEDVIGGNVTGATFKIIEEGLEELFSCPVELDSSLSHICVSACGRDKLGWVAKLTKVVSENDANVTHSKMVRLGQEFIILMHVSIEPEGLPKLLSALRTSELKELGIRATGLTSRGTHDKNNVHAGFHIHCSGKDKKGMLSAISGRLAQRNLSVENLTTELRVGKQGRRDFVVECDCVTSQKLTKDDRDEIVRDIHSLKNDLSLDVVHVRMLKVEK